MLRCWALRHARVGCAHVMYSSGARAEGAAIVLLGSSDEAVGRLLGCWGDGRAVLQGAQEVNPAGFRLKPKEECRLQGVHTPPVL